MGREGSSYYVEEAQCGVPSEETKHRIATHLNTHTFSFLGNTTAKST